MITPAGCNCIGQAEGLDSSWISADHIQPFDLKCIRFGNLAETSRQAQGAVGGRIRYFLNSGLLFSKNAEMPSLAASEQAISPKPLYPTSRAALRLFASAPALMVFTAIETASLLST